MGSQRVRHDWVSNTFTFILLSIHVSEHPKDHLITHMRKLRSYQPSTCYFSREIKPLTTDAPRLFPPVLRRTRFMWSGWWGQGTPQALLLEDFVHTGLEEEAPLPAPPSSVSLGSKAYPRNRFLPGGSPIPTITLFFFPSFPGLNDFQDFSKTFSFLVWNHFESSRTP